MTTIEFTYNWNNKLDCKCFTTIRLSNPSKYVIGNDYKLIEIKKKEIVRERIVKIIDIKDFLLQNLNSFMSYIDTGYSVKQTTDIILKMYPKVNFLEKHLSFILLKYGS